MDAQGCESLMRNLVILDTRLSSLVLRDVQARPICSGLPSLAPATEMSQSADFAAALHSEGFVVGGAEPGHTSERRVSVLTYPVRNQAGERVGLLRLVHALQKLSADLLGGLPPTGLATVLDGREITAMRSAGVLALALLMAWRLGLQVARPVAPLAEAERRGRSWPAAPMCAKSRRNSI